MTTPSSRAIPGCLCVMVRCCYQLFSSVVLTFEEAIWHWSYCKRQQAKQLLESQLYALSFLFLLRQGLTEIGYLEIPLSLLPKCWGYRYAESCLAFYVGSEDPNSGPHACCRIPKVLKRHSWGWGNKAQYSNRQVAQSHSQLAVRKWRKETNQPGGLQSKIISQKTKRKSILNVSNKTANCYIKTVVGTIENLAQW